MLLNQSIPVAFGPFRAQVFGGPFRAFVPGTRRLVGIKMASEIVHTHDFSIPTEDYSIPTTERMVHGLKYAIDQIAAGNDIYVGCMGGTGRTGVFMGCLAKVMMDFDFAKVADGNDYTPDDPVMFVRAHYRSHAIETSEQERFVRNFPTEGVVKHIRDVLESLFNEVGPAEVVQVEKVVEVEKLVTPFDYFMRFFFPHKS